MGFQPSRNPPKPRPPSVVEFDVNDVEVDWEVYVPDLEVDWDCRKHEPKPFAGYFDREWKENEHERNDNNRGSC